MIYKCCDRLLHKLAIGHSEITFCCEPYSPSLPYIKNYDGIPIDIDNYKKVREQYIDMFKKGNIPVSCQNCYQLQEKDWDESFGLNFISISSQTKCSCNCIYCTHTKGDIELKRYMNTQKCYDVRPIINALYNDNLILKNCIIVIAGGEPTEMPNDQLEYLLYFGLVTGVMIVILSNGLLYNENIAKTISVACSELKVSVDAGTKETFEKIKGVRGFDKVWKNLKKYINVAKTNMNAKVQIKYIIIPGVNDNMKEVTSFINRCFDIGCMNIEISIENSWYADNKDKPISEELRNILEYFDSLKDKGVAWGDAKNWFIQKLNEK